MSCFHVLLEGTPWAGRLRGRVFFASVRIVLKPHWIQHKGIIYMIYNLRVKSLLSSCIFQAEIY